MNNNMPNIPVPGYKPEQPYHLGPPGFSNQMINFAPGNQNINPPIPPFPQGVPSTSPPLMFPAQPGISTLPQGFTGPNYTGGPSAYQPPPQGSSGGKIPLGPQGPPPLPQGVPAGNIPSGPTGFPRQPLGIPTTNIPSGPPGFPPQPLGIPTTNIPLGPPGFTPPPLGIQASNIPGNTTINNQKLPLNIPQAPSGLPPVPQISGITHLGTINYPIVSPLGPPPPLTPPNIGLKMPPTSNIPPIIGLNMPPTSNIPPPTGFQAPNIPPPAGFQAPNIPPPAGFQAPFIAPPIQGLNGFPPSAPFAQGPGGNLGMPFPNQINPHFGNQTRSISIPNPPSVTRVKKQFQAEWDSINNIFPNNLHKNIEDKYRGTIECIGTTIIISHENEGMLGQMQKELDDLLKRFTFDENARWAFLENDGSYHLYDQECNYVIESGYRSAYYLISLPEYQNYSRCVEINANGATYIIEFAKLGGVHRQKRKNVHMDTIRAVKRQSAGEDLNQNFLRNYKWLWRHESGQFREYEPDATFLIEISWQEYNNNKSNSIALIQGCNGNTYKIDFSNQTQFNEITNFKRPIRRETIN